MNDIVREVMTASPCIISASDSAMTAAQAMRANDIGDVIVLENNRLVGILTDRDIVVRVLAVGANPDTTTAGSVCSRELTTITPTASVGEAMRLMRDKAIRRLPVVDASNRVLGVVSLGDLAAERGDTALADISAAPPNV